MPRTRKFKSLQDAADRAERVSAGLPPDDLEEREFGPSREVPRGLGASPEEIPEGISTVAATPPSGAGRPTEFKPEYIQVAATLASGGCTDEEIATELGIYIRTLYLWKSKHPEFKQAIELGKEASLKNQNNRVKGALYHRAIGYTYDTVKVFNHQGTPLIVPVKEHIPPDVSAGKYWLEQRDPEHWKSAIATQVNNLTINGEVDKVALARWIAQQITAVTEPATKLVEVKDE